MATTIDLSRHGVIEAHAGTGKTWTIVNRLVLPILAGDGCARTHIRDILLVTYTEKAAGELRKRIRAGIEESIRKEPPGTSLRRHLEDCLSNVHEAFIGTIHAVCLRLLQGYPFESGMQFVSDPADDEAGLRQSLRECIRQEWPDWGVDLSWLLGSIPSSGKQAIDARLLSGIVSVARECLDPDVRLCNYILDSFGGTLEGVIEAVRARQRLCALVVERIEAALPAIRAVAGNPAGLDDVRAAAVADLLSTWERLSRTGKVARANDVISGRAKAGWLENKLVSGNKKKAATNPLIADACAAFSAVVGSEQFAELRNSGEPELALLAGIILKAVPGVCRRWREKKEREGLISFQDMLRATRNAVYESEGFRAVVRSRIRFAVIDEFQDTSVLQWEIFRRLFLVGDHDGFAPRLFVVGDPKQSIYRFQGADVGSYIDAARTIGARDDSQDAPLRYSYRSLPSAIDGYNEILTYRPESALQDENEEGGAAEDAGEEEERSTGFFLSDEIVYTSDNRALPPPERDGPGVPAGPVAESLMSTAVKVIPLAGSAGTRMHAYARTIARVVRRLVGQQVTVPDGLEWRRITLDYSDFAVIAESHNGADTVLSRLLDAGIPAAKYKADGVFRSPMAVEFRAVLEAIRSANHECRLRALLTSFFNRSPGAIEPDRDLEPGSPPARLFERWESLAGEGRWGQLFRSLLVDSGVRELLVRLVDGQRKISDLRQVMDYCLAYLTRNEGALGELIERLANLENGAESAAEEESLHARESDSRRVQVMTIHAAKGLEFPVCFVVTGSSKSVSNSLVSWIEPVEIDGANAQRLQVMPAVSDKVVAWSDRAKAGKLLAQRQTDQERRRLLYVAMTRAKALLVLPMHLGELPDPDHPERERTRFRDCRPGSGTDNDLTPILTALADRSAAGDSRIGVLRAGDPLTGDGDDGVGPVRYIDDLAPPSRDVLDSARTAVLRALEAMKIRSRARVQTSYTRLAHDMPEAGDIEGRTEHEPEAEIDEKVSAGEVERTESARLLRPGKETGKALHKILEVMVQEGIGCTCAEGEPTPRLRDLAGQWLAWYGLTRGVGDKDQALMVDHTLTIVCRAVTTPYELPGGGTVRLADLRPSDLKAEAEFHLDVAPDRVLGYIDLLFRVRRDDGTYRYFVLDWKTNYLDRYSCDAIDASVRESHYDLQAQLYSHALDRWLGTLLGGAYDPARHLGGAVYVYLRGLAEAGVSPVWSRAATPLADREFVIEKVAAFAGRQE